MKAELWYYSKDTLPGGFVKELVVWKLAKSSLIHPHGVKYRLYFGAPDGACLIRYDNKRGNGDHRHVGNREEFYNYSTPEQLIEDFLNDVNGYLLGM